MENYMERVRSTVEECQRELQEEMRGDIDTVRVYLEKTLKSGWCTEAHLRLVEGKRVTRRNEWICIPNEQINDMLKDISRICLSQDRLVYNYRRRQLAPLWEEFLKSNNSEQKSILTLKISRIEELALQYEIIEKAMKLLIK